MVQIAGGIPWMMADAARINVDEGAQIIDINMGCPAKKVCRVDAGSALLRDTAAGRIDPAAVVAAVEVPVTLKIRTGWSRADAQCARSRAHRRGLRHPGFDDAWAHARRPLLGSAEYETIRAVKSAVSIPVIANGDIDSAKKAKMVMDFTAADAIMVGRIRAAASVDFQPDRAVSEQPEIRPTNPRTTQKKLAHRSSTKPVRVLRRVSGGTNRA